MIGNFIADHVKGRKINDFNQKIQTGIRLHRAIDTFTDKHPLFIASCKRLNGEFGRYSPVIMDMFYDHFLAANWAQYNPTPIREFTENNFSILFAHFDLLPERTKYILPYMARENWLMSYSDLLSLQNALNGISRRTSLKLSLGDAIHNLRTHYTEYQKDFRAYMPEVISFTENHITNQSFQ